MEIDREDFRKKFPRLWEELEGKVITQKLQVTGIVQTDKFRDYMPTVVDYIRRCDTIEDAEKTILYLLEKGEMTTKDAEEFRKQLRERGLESFGTKKKDGSYLIDAGLV